MYQEPETNQRVSLCKTLKVGRKEHRESKTGQCNQWGVTEPNIYLAATSFGMTATCRDGTILGPILDVRGGGGSLVGSKRISTFIGRAR